MTVAWEYEVLRCYHIGSDAEYLAYQRLDELGGKGWELVSVSRNGDHSTFYLKRPSTKPSDIQRRLA